MIRYSKKLNCYIKIKFTYQKMLQHIRPFTYWLKSNQPTNESQMSQMSNIAIAKWQKDRNVIRID